MPKMKLEMRINRDMFKSLSKMPAELAKKTAPRMIRKGATMLNKASQPKTPVGQARTGKKAGKPHLKDTLRVSKTRKYKNGQLVYVAAGPQYPQGAHGHLVHEGFIHQPDGKMTRGNDFYQRAYDVNEGKIWLAQAKMARRAIERYFKSIKKQP